jgi:hypothetical protein
MSLTQEIADLSKKELAALEAVRSALNDNTSDREQISKQSLDLSDERWAVFARFQVLSNNMINTVNQHVSPKP